jgi:hypothetical protein
MITCVTVGIVYIGVDIYRRIELQHMLLAEIASIAGAGLQSARFDIGEESERRICFLETDPTDLRYLAEELSRAVAEGAPDRTLVVAEFTVTLSTSKSQQRQLAGWIYSKAPMEVFFGDYPFGDSSGTRETPQAFEVRIPELAGWVSKKFRQHGCIPQ